MEVLEAINGVHDVHLRDKCQRAITAVQRTIDLYGCAHKDDSHVMHLPMFVCLSVWQCSATFVLVAEPPACHLASTVARTQPSFCTY